MLSIVIPVFNSEDTLERCLDSLLLPSTSYFEVIAVDDGSTDSSLGILEKYASVDPRIQIIRSKNAGPAAARNLGILHAQGDYIAFCDSDDWIDSRAFDEAINEYVSSASFDIYIYGYKNVRSSGTVTHKCFLPKEYDSSEYAKAVLLNPNVEGFLWNKIYRRNLFDGCMLDERDWICEDLIFNCRLAARESTLKAFCIPLSCYNYDLRNSSLTRGEDRYWEIRDAILSLNKTMPEAVFPSVQAALYSRAVKQRFSHRPFSQEDLHLSSWYWMGSGCPIREKMKTLVRTFLVHFPSFCCCQNDRK